MQEETVAPSSTKTASHSRRQRAETAGGLQRQRSRARPHSCRSGCRKCYALLNSRSWCRSGWDWGSEWAWGPGRPAVARGPRPPQPHCRPRRSVCSAKRAARALRSRATSCSSWRTTSAPISTSRGPNATSSRPLSASPKHRCVLCINGAVLFPFQEVSASTCFRVLLLHIPYSASRR